MEMDWNSWSIMRWDGDLNLLISVGRGRVWHGAELRDPGRREHQAHAGAAGPLPPPPPGKCPADDPFHPEVSVSTCPLRIQFSIVRPNINTHDVSALTQPLLSGVVLSPWKYLCFLNLLPRQNIFFCDTKVPFLGWDLVRVYRHTAEIHPESAGLHTNLAHRAPPQPAPQRASGTEETIKYFLSSNIFYARICRSWRTCWWSCWGCWPATASRCASWSCCSPRWRLWRGSGRDTAPSCSTCSGRCPTGITSS